MTSKVWVLTNTSTLVYGGEWKDAESSIRAKVFGHMVELAQNRVNYYKSDLFHDALWLKGEMTGPMSFEWIARESGTHIGEVCRYVKDDDWSDLARYRFEILGDEKSRWILNIYESKEDVIPWVDRHATLDVSECDVAKSIEGCIFHPAPIGGWTKEEQVCTSDDPNNHQGDTCPVHEGVSLPTDIDYSENEAYQLTIEKFPTLGNIERKENKMEQIISDLREKYDEASNSKDQLEEYKDNINDAVDELDSYMSDLDDLISSLDRLPEVSVYVDLDTVSFDS